MVRRTLTAVLAGLAVVSAVAAQETGPFRFQAGQSLAYRVEHSTTLTDVKEESRDETRMNVQLLKRWQVLDVDAAGVATLQLSLQSMRYEMLRPGSEPIRFDSADPDKAPADLRKQFMPFVGQPLGVIRIDSQGKVVEVKDARNGYISAAKLETDLPFKAILPGQLREGQAWDRDYKVMLEAGQGTGEKYPAVQHHLCKKVADNLATVEVKSEVKAPPEASSDLMVQMVLWQMQPEGEIVFDRQAGRLKSAVLKIDREQKGAQGKDSSVRFQSTYIEQYCGDR